MTEPTEAAKARAVELANKNIGDGPGCWLIEDCEAENTLHALARYIQQVSDAARATASNEWHGQIHASLIPFILPPDPDPLEEAAHGIWAAMGGKTRGQAVQALKAELDRAGYEIRKKDRP